MELDKQYLGVFYLKNGLNGNHKEDAIHHCDHKDKQKVLDTCH